MRAVYPKDSDHLCECGCGTPTAIAQHTSTQRGVKAGEPTRYIPGHNSRRGSLKERLEKKINRLPDGCWQWTGFVLWNGYGRIGAGNRADGTRRVMYAHRAAYEIYVGPIPQGHDLDHLCRRRDCVNPSHLEPVTHRENCLRGDAPNIKAFLSGKCKKGHDLTPENTVTERRSNGASRLRCRVCRNEKQRRHNRVRHG